MKTTVINNKEYRYDVLIRNGDEGYDAVHIVQPCHNIIELTDLSVKCIKKYTEHSYVVWLVDNFSNRKTRNFISQLKDVNIIFNHTKIGTFFRPWHKIPYGGSLANAIALELAAKVVNCKYMFVMHNDCVPCKKGWLSYLKSKLNDEVKIAGARQDPTRVKALHQSGFIFVFELYKKLNLSFMHNMPIYDVGDQITLGLLKNGYKYFVCKNTFNNPETIELLNSEEVYPDFLRKYVFDKCFNDDGELIYLHLGRGTLKHRDDFLKEKRLPTKDWIYFINKYFLEENEYDRRI
ncbi:hypothetical protein ES702_00070 [subsurface metagenome]